VYSEFMGFPLGWAMDLEIVPEELRAYREKPHR
jgi:hypothetical protein